MRASSTEFSIFRNNCACCPVLKLYPYLITALGIRTPRDYVAFGVLHEGVAAAEHIARGEMFKRGAECFEAVDFS